MPAWFDPGLFAIAAFVVIVSFALGWWSRGCGQRRIPVVVDDPEATLRIPRRTRPATSHRGGAHRAR